MTFTVPASAKNGPTRLRIQLHFGWGSTNPCATLNNGDVQDYTVIITGGKAPIGVAVTSVQQAIDEPDKSTTVKDAKASLKIIPNPVPSSISPTAMYRLISDGNVNLKVIDLGGRVLHHVNLGIQNAGPHIYLLSNLGNHLSPGYYIIVLEQNKQVIARNPFIVR